MNCRKVKSIISAYLLGELSQEEMTLVSSHLRLCPNCTAEYENLSKTIQEAKDIPPLETNATRRENTIKAMLSIENKNHRIIKFPRYILYAASLITAIGIFIFVFVKPKTIDTGLRVEEIRGKIIVQKGKNLGWDILQKDSTINDGDWLTSELGSFLKLVSNEDIFYVSGESLLKFANLQGKRYIVMYKGNIYADLRKSECIIVDPENDKAFVKNAKFEAGLRYTISIKTPKYEPTNTRIAFKDQPLCKITTFLEEMISKNITFSDETLGKKNVNFYSDKTSPDEVLKDFIISMREQGFEMALIEKDKYKLIPFIRPETTYASRRLYVRLEEGSATLVGATSTKIFAGEEASIDASGFSFTRRINQQEIAKWVKTAPRVMLASERVPISLELCYIGKNENPLDTKLSHGETGLPVEWRLQEQEVSMNLGNKSGTLFVSQGDIAKFEEGKEITIPIKFLFKTDKGR